MANGSLSPSSSRKWREKKRSCTDIPCLLIFLVFVICWFFVGYVAIENGNLSRLREPKDSQGKRCGFDENVLDKPNLVFFDLKKCVKLGFKSKCNTTKMCVDKCPDKNWFFDASDNIEDIQNNIMCKDEINKLNYKSPDKFEELINKGSCARWYLKSKSIFHRCIPVPGDIPDNLYNKTISKEILNKIQATIGYGGEIIDKIMGMRWILLLIMLGSVLLCFLTILSFKWIAKPCVYLSMITIICGLGYATYFFYGWSRDENSNHRKYWLSLSLFLGILDVLIILLSCCLFKRIKLACAIIKETSNAVMSSISSLFFPIFPWIFHLIVFIYMFFILINLYTIDGQFTIQEKNNSNNACHCTNETNYLSGLSCDPDDFKINCKENGKMCTSRMCESTNKWYNRLNYLYGIHFFGSIWLWCFINAVGQLILASTFSTWYWTFDKKNFKYFIITSSTLRIFRYHLGTAAFGSLLITIVRSFRYILTYLQKKTVSDAPGASYLKPLYCCAQCFLSLIEKLIKFINTNAYIMVSIHGKGLCASAANGLSLLARNIGRTLVLNNITNFILFVGKILLTSIVGFSTWWYLSRDSQFDSNSIVSLSPLILVCLFTYFIVDMFFDVYEMAVDTIFLCFLQDCEVNDGSAEKPYFMTFGLAKVFKMNNQ